MSDDDYAADSPFDGLDDYYFWDDAASQDVADDLAEHTMPSPVYLEDPAFEMMGGYSDWEYYSDDYYDDDPDLLKNNPQAGSPPAALKSRNRQTNSHTEQKRGRKRKLVDTEDIPTLSLGGPGLVEIVQNIGQNITGTTWKTEKSVSEKLYHQGEAKRVALLKDWRSVFRESQPKSDRRSTGTSKQKAALQDEWANNLSLADMGLMTATGKPIPTNDIGNDYDDDDEDEEVDSERGRHFQDGVSSIERAVPLDGEADVSTGILGDDDQEFYAAEPTKVNAQSLEQSLPSRKRKKTTGDEGGPGVLDPMNESDIELQLAERIFLTSKKRKTGSIPSASARSIRNSNTTNELGALESQANGTQKRGRGRPNKQTIPHAEAKSASLGNARNATAKTATASKKRKATTEASAENDDGATERDQSSGATVAKASSRAKRVASDTTGVRNDDGNRPMAQLPKPTTRGARTRKK
jgi:hypothetical protein